jgi:hypothetical protein
MSKIEIATRLLFLMHWFSDLVEERTKMYSPSHMIPLREVKTYYARQQEFEAEFAKVMRLLTQTMSRLDNAEYNCVFNEYADQKQRERLRAQYERERLARTDGTTINWAAHLRTCMENQRELRIIEDERARALIPADVQNAANRLILERSINGVPLDAQDVAAGFVATPNREGEE